MKSMFVLNRERDFDSFFREEIVDSYSVSGEIVNKVKLSTKKMVELLIENLLIKK